MRAGAQARGGGAGGIVGGGAGGMHPITDFHKEEQVPTRRVTTRRGFTIEGALKHRIQLEDGSWLVRSRSKPFQAYFESGFPHGHDQWVSSNGTAWAAIALSYATPER